MSLNFMIKLKIGISAGLLVCGPAALASTTSELETISSWTAHLNRHFPSLNLYVAEPIDSPQDLNEVLKDLKTLEDQLHGEVLPPPHSLKSLACSKPACGDFSVPGGIGK